MSKEKELPALNIDIQDRVHDYHAYSQARLGLGHAGGHIKTKDWLEFQQGFAQAKDAVFSQFDTGELARLCDALQLPNLLANSQATDIMHFLSRPDTGRLLHPEDELNLQQISAANTQYSNRDLLIVISGGLSPLAIQQQVPGLLPLFLAEIHRNHWSLAPVIINPRGRVALGDQLNTIFKAKLVIMLIGERPGLTTPDSLGIYFTYNARLGCTDDLRNCISNIHLHGLSHESAIEKLCRLLQLALQKKVTGIELKDDLAGNSLG